MFAKQHTNGVYSYEIVVLYLAVFSFGIVPRQHVAAPVPTQNVSNNGNISNIPRLADHEYAYVSSWPIVNRTLGSVSAVAIDGTANVVIFHRASHVWTLNSFDGQNKFLEATGGPIPEQTVLKFDRNSGELLQEWGANMFYMPHGLTIDHEHNYWLTDVALHQVFKFDLNRSTSEPALILGTPFEPGDDMYHFCKPTSVAVLKTGEFFVADGYCNGRIVKYSPEGIPILSWGRNSFILTRTFTLPPGPVPENFFAIPHALTLAYDRELLCVADREQGRVQCFHTYNGTFHSQFSSSQIGSRLFSVKYIPKDGGLLYTINGPQFLPDSKTVVGGYIVEMTSGNVVGRFLPNNTGHAFSNPHELAVTEDGEEVYVAELNPQLVHKFRRIVQHPAPNLPPQKGLSVVDRTDLHMETSGNSSTLTVGSIGIFSIVSTLIVTFLLVVLMARIFCVRSEKEGSRVDEVPLRNMHDEA